MSWQNLWALAIGAALLFASPATAMAQEPGPAHDHDAGEGVPEVVPALIAGIGGAALVGGMVTAALALSTHGELDRVDTLAEKRDLVDTGRTLATATDALLIGGAALVFVGVVWLEALDREDPHALHVAPMLDPDAIGLGVGWGF